MILFFYRYLPVHSSFNAAKKTATISKKDDINYYVLTDFSTRSMNLIFNIYFPSDEVFTNVLIVKLINYRSSEFLNLITIFDFFRISNN